MHDSPLPTYLGSLGTTLGTEVPYVGSQDRCLSPKETSKLDVGPVDLPKLPVGRLTGSTHSLRHHERHTLSVTILALLQGC